MPRSRLVLLLFALFVGISISGCPRQITGFLISVRANIKPQQPYETIRNAILATGGFEGPIEAYGGGGLCQDQKYYRKLLPKSGIKVFFYDCYRTSQFSETGWVYSASLSGESDALRPDVRAEMEIVAEEIRSVIQQVVPTAKITTLARDTGYGFSLLPY